MSPLLTGDIDDQGALLLGEAARLLDTSADPLAIADAIERMPADHWDAAVLDRLGGIALELGAWVRRLAAMGEQD